MKKGILFALAVCPAMASAFFDDFNGTSLGSHWNFYSEGSNWQYSVSGGALTVTALSGPFDFDEVNIYAPIEGFTDFEAEVRVHWNLSPHQTFSFGLAEFFPQNPLIGRVSYSITPTSSGTVSAFLNSGGSGSTSSTSEGFHTLRITRTGSNLSAFFNGQLLASTNTAVADPANVVFLHFAGPETDDFGYIDVDYVSIVPEPSTLAFIGLGTLALLRRGRRASE